MSVEQIGKDAKASRLKTILFIAEAVTLAQVVRLYELACALVKRDRQSPGGARLRVVFASAVFDPLVFSESEKLGIERRSIWSVSARALEFSTQFGTKLYTKRALRRYIKDDLRLIDELLPECVIGDLRWSLPISCGLRKIPVISVINAYWSPYSTRVHGTPMPDHPIVRLLGYETAWRYYPQAIGKAFDSFAKPVNDLRLENGLAPIGSLRETLTWGERVVFPDAPELTPTDGGPPHHIYLGPVLWAPRVADSGWKDALESARASKKKIVYVTLGSSGAARKLPAILEALSELDVSAIVATAGRAKIRSAPKNSFLCEYVPGDVVAKSASLAVSNGGSTTGYQALSEGAPVFGVPRNLDQYLATQAIDGFGAGRSIRSGEARKPQLQEEILKALEDPSLPARAEDAKRALGALDARSGFIDLVWELI